MIQQTSIQDALRRAEQLRPNYVHLIRQFYPIEMEGLAGVTGDRYLRLYYDPIAISQLEVDWVSTRILVIVEHYVRLHGDRQLGRSELLWNVSAELAIMSSFQYEEIKIPPGTLIPEDFKLADGLAAEQYYEQLVELCSKRKEEILALSKSQKFGSAATSDLLDWEVPEDEAPAIDRLVALMLQQEMFKSIVPGKGVGDQHLEAADNQESSIDYRLVLRGVIGSVLSNRPGMEDWSYQVVDTDCVQLRTINPGLVSRKMIIACVIDTSSSMNQEMLSQAIAEVGSVLRSLEHNDGVFVYTCDSAVHDARQVFNRHQVNLVGGGGTDMGVGIRAATAHYPHPDIVIVMTDGYTDWPKRPPRNTPVVVLLVGGGKAPAWAHTTIKIEV